MGNAGFISSTVTISAPPESREELGMKPNLTDKETIRNSLFEPALNNGKKTQQIARSAWKLWATAAELSWRFVAELSEFTNSSNATSQEL